MAIDLELEPLKVHQRAGCNFAGASKGGALIARNMHTTHGAKKKLTRSE